MRLKPFIQHCVVVALLVLPAPSWAVGLGRLTLQSGLGQALSAEIELTSVQPGELDTLTARLADQATYSSNKIEYGGALTRIRVALDQRGARPVLRVTSTQPINEPFLDLLIELNWSAGRLLREYTFLLDPPGFAATTPVEPTPAIPAQVLAPTAPAVVIAVAPVAAPAPTAAPAPAVASPAAPSKVGQAAGEESYGPVKRGETLSKIAAKVKPDGVSLEQMLAALYRANANVFDDQNMNRLRTGRILTVPKAEEAASIPSTEAKKEIRVQAAQWRAYRDRVAGSVSIGATQSTRQAAGGRITSALEDKSAAPPGADKLRLSKGETSRGATGTAGRAENSLALQKTAAEANSRVADLEKQVKDLQRLLELKNSALQAQQLAVEQAREATKAAVASAAASSKALAANPSVPAPPPVQIVPPTPAAPTPVQPLPSPPVSPAPIPFDALAKVEPAAKSAAPGIAEPAKVETPTQAPSVEATVARTEPPVTKTASVSPPTQQELSFLDDLSASPLVLVGGATVIGLGGLAWILARRRRDTTSKFEDSIGAGSDIRTSTVFGNTGGGVVNTGDNSLVSDFSREGLGNIDTGEVDPIAEAEVYLAYGRDNQAEEILRDALGKTPDRQEIRLKLLEIYAQQNKPSVFEPIAKEVFAATKGSGDIWKKTAQLGRGIDPANSLYAESTGDGGEASIISPTAMPTIAEDRLPDTRARVAAAVEKSARETAIQRPEPPAREVLVVPPALTPPERAPATVTGPMSLSAPLAAAAAASVAAAARANAVQDRAPLDFKLDSGPELVPQGVPPTMDFVTLDGPITLSGATTLSGPSTLSGVTMASPFADIWGEKPLAPPLPEESNVARQLQTPELKPADALKPVAAGPAVAVPPGSPAPGSSIRAPQPTANLDLDKLDLSFDPSRKTFEDPTPSVLDGQWHDAATKLDLAKAYQEMGDVEGAREILQEVMQEGDEHQKKKAQAFLGKLRT